jgi:hypothetical protein
VKKNFLGGIEMNSMKLNDLEKEEMGYLVPNFTRMVYVYFKKLEDANVYRKENKGFLSKNGQYRVEIVKLRDGEVPELMQDGAWGC